MSINMNDDKNIPTDTEAYYQTVASQEEIYREEVEEELRAILIFSDPSPSRREMKRSMTNPKNDPRLAESPDEQINHAAEELITGDSDDPPLREEEVVEMLNDSHAQRPEIVELTVGDKARFSRPIPPQFSPVRPHAPRNLHRDLASEPVD